MKQTNDSSLRNEAGKWWNSLPLEETLRLMQKYPQEAKFNFLSAIESIYQQETKPTAIIGSGVEEGKAIGGEWYFYDSKKGTFSGYGVGEWIQIELATKFSNKKHDTRSIGKLSFTGLGGRDELDQIVANATMKKMCEAVNNYKILTENADTIRDSNAELLKALELAERAMSDMVEAFPFYNDDYAEIKAAINKAKSIK